MGAKVETVKKEVGDILKKIYSKLTPNQGKIGSLILSAIIALLFLCTATGRTVIVFAGYLIFVLCILTFAYKLYKFASEYSTAVPKPKKVPVEEDNLSEAEDDYIEENDESTEETEEAHQITMDEIEETFEKQEESRNSIE